jgi:UDPglucose--hexose-1-phosphate uridylyltransferase
MLLFEKQTIQARMLLPDGRAAARPIEVRRNPITGRTCRITLSRAEEREPGAASLPAPPPFAADRSGCPFCPGALAARTPRLTPELAPAGSMQRGRSVLFPNLFPYGSHSAVSLFDDRHFVEIGTASPDSYTDCFLNCRDYLLRVLEHDPPAVYMAITQNHLPSAGGSLLHPHLQLQADPVASNHHRFLQNRASEHLRETGTRLFSAYLEHERKEGSRRIGQTGAWEWLAAFAPEGFFEIWGVLPGVASIRRAQEEDWRALARGVIQAQKFYRSLNRNGYNLGLLLIEDGLDVLELRVVMVVRSNYAAWVRSDHTGFEVMLGDMATFTAPEQTAQLARPFWNGPYSA